LSMLLLRVKCTTIQGFSRMTHKNIQDVQKYSSSEITYYVEIGPVASHVLLSMIPAIVKCYCTWYRY
jgi:hypothetical protein